MLKEFHKSICKQVSEPTYVLDKPRIHTAVRWEQLSPGPHPIVAAPHPRRSPDFNRPAEHFLQAVKREFKELLRVIDAPREPVFYERMLRQAYENCCTNKMKRAINKDIITLPNLWAHVSTPKPVGSGGDWPAAKFR